MKRLSKPLIAVIVTLIVALVAGMVSAVWIIMTPLTTETGSTFRPDNIEEKVTISFNYGEFSEVSDYPANQEAHAPIEAIADRDVTLPTADELTKEGEPYKPAGYGLSAWESNNGVRYEPGETAKFSSDVTMTPVWAKVVTVTFNSVGKENITKKIQIEAGASFSDTLAYKSEAWPTALEKQNQPSGKTFTGWKDSTGIYYTNTSIFNADVTLTAQFSFDKFFDNFPNSLYFGIVGQSSNLSSNTPLNLTNNRSSTNIQWFVGKAALLMFAQDKENKYDYNETTHVVTPLSTGPRIRYVQEIYLYSGDRFDVIGTSATDKQGAPDFEDSAHKAEEDGGNGTYGPNGGWNLQQQASLCNITVKNSSGGTLSNSTTISADGKDYVVHSAGTYRIEMYVPTDIKLTHTGSADFIITQLSTTAPSTSTTPHIVYSRNSMNNWLNDWTWGAYKPLTETDYTSSVYRFEYTGTTSGTSTIYHYEYYVTLKDEDIKSGTAYKFKAYDANALTWIDATSSNTTKPTSGVTVDGEGNISISATGIWKITVQFSLSGGAPSTTSIKYAVSKVSHTVNFSYGAGYDGETPPAERVVKSGDELTLPGAPARAGYKFDGWKSSIATDSTLYRQGDPYKVTADVTFTAQWTPLITVTYTDPEFPDRVTTHQYVEADHSADYTAPDASTWPVGRKFAGWHVSYNKDTGEWGDYYRGEPITEATTLYAKWDYIEYTVKFASAINDATLAGLPTGEYKVSLEKGHETLNLAEITPPTLTGYTFAHWTFGATINLNTFTLTEDDVKGMVEGSTELTLTAQWTAITYKIVFDPNKPAAAGKEEVLNLDERDTVYVTREAGKDEIRLPIGYMKNDKVDYEQGVFLRGYRLKGWNLKEWLEDGSAHSPLMGTTYLDTDMIEKAELQGGEYVITFYADWYEGTLDINVPHEHTISYSFNSYGGVVYPLEEEKGYHTEVDWTQWGDKNYEHSKMASPNVNIAPAPHWAGFKFEYWDYRDYAYILGLENAKHQYNAGDIFTIDEFDGPQITFDAVWSPIKYTINFETNTKFLTQNGAVSPVITGLGTQSIQMTRLDSIILESVNTKGFTFTGWEIATRDASGAEGTVTINPGDAFTISTAMIAFANKGHTDDETELTLTAQWEKTSYDVVFLTNGHGTAPANTTITLDGSVTLSDHNVTLTADEAKEVEFNGWIGPDGKLYGAGQDLDKYTLTYDLIPDNDAYHVIYFSATWKSALTLYNITFHDWNGNVREVRSVESGSHNISEFDIVLDTYTETNKSSRKLFLGWSESQNSHTAETKIVVEENIDLYPAFTLEFHVYWYIDSTSKYTYDQWVQSGTNVQSHAYGSETGYTWDGWYTSSTYSTKASFPSTISSSKSYYGRWMADVKLYVHSPWQTAQTARAYLFGASDSGIKTTSGANFSSSPQMTRETETTGNYWYYYTIGKLSKATIESGTATFNLIVFVSGNDWARIEKGDGYKYHVHATTLYVAMNGMEKNASGSYFTSKTEVTNYENALTSVMIHAQNATKNGWSALYIHVWDNDSQYAGKYTTWETRPKMTDTMANNVWTYELKNLHRGTVGASSSYLLGCKMTESQSNENKNHQTDNIKYRAEVWISSSGALM